MKTSEHSEFIDFLLATMEIYGFTLTKPSLAIWVSALAKFELDDVRGALSQHVQTPGTGKFAPKPADIIGLLQEQDGHLNADEAWGLIPKSELDSAVLTQEMLSAMSVAQSLLDEGDPIAARMAFRDGYNRLVAESRRLGVKVKWIPSLGWDVSQREAVLNRAVSQGRLQAAYVAKLLPRPEVKALELVRKPVQGEREAGLEKLELAKEQLFLHG